MLYLVRTGRVNYGYEVPWLNFLGSIHQRDRKRSGVIADPGPGRISEQTPSVTIAVSPREVRR